MKFETTDKLKELDMMHIGAASTKLRSAQRDADGLLRLLTRRPCSTHRRIGLHEKLEWNLCPKGQWASSKCFMLIRPALAQLCLDSARVLWSNPLQFLFYNNAITQQWHPVYSYLCSTTRLCCCLLTQVEQRKNTSQLHPGCIPSLWLKILLQTFPARQ